MPVDLRDCVVVITGAARGMGNAYIDAFLELGARTLGSDESGDTGRAFDAVQWNVRHGFGGADQWLAQPANNPGR